MEALRDGLRRVSTAGDPGLARAARSLAAKIGAVAPAPQDPDEDDIFTFRPAATAVAEGLVPALRAAVNAAAARLVEADHCVARASAAVRVTNQTII